MSKIETNTIDTVSGTTNLTIGSSNASTVTFESGATTGHMNPAFLAYLSSSYEVGNNVITKVNCNTEVYDTDNCYDNSTNYRFTPTKAGKYFVYINLCGETNAYKLYFMKAKLYKNGSQEVSATNVFNTDTIQRIHSQLEFVVDMNGSSDYLEMYGHIDIHSNGTEQFLGGSDKRTYFGAYRIGA